MASYYKHKATHNKEIPYSFQCEHCMKESGLLSATISGNTMEYDSPSKTLNEKQQEKLNHDAHMSLKKRLHTDYTNATEKQIFSPAFKDECPLCKKPQSWAISGAKRGMVSTPISILVAGILVSLGVYFFTDVKSMGLTLGICGVSILAAVGYLIFKLVKIGSKSRKAAPGLQKNIPVIDWTIVSDLLNES